MPADELLLAVVVVGFTLVELAAVALELVCAVPSLVDAAVELTSDVEFAVGELLNSPSPHPACTKLKAQQAQRAEDWTTGRRFTMRDMLMQ